MFTVKTLASRVLIYGTVHLAPIKKLSQKEFCTYLEITYEYPRNRAQIKKDKWFHFQKLKKIL